MSLDYKKMLLKEIEGLPEEIMPKLYRIIRVLKSELIPKEKKPRGSLKGIWKGSQIDDTLIFEAKKSLFPYNYT